LFADRYVCVLCADHPLAGCGGAPALADYLDCRHVIVDIAEARQGALDIRLEALGRPRRRAATVPYHGFAAAAVDRTRLVATLPRRFVDGLATADHLAVIPAPTEIGPMSFAMAWHPRLDDDPAQRWLRQMIRAAANPENTPDQGPAGSATAGLCFQQAAS
jgi:DNA-binding transcriptional LysR family regulator